LLPSEVEGMPLSVMEAMAKGLPIAATAISGIPEELGETGQLLPDPNLDPEATVRSLVETIQTWAVDADLRDRIGRASRERAVRMFREEQMLECYVKLIQGVICSLSTSG
jgi:glycosyltransferase involved in cell wall biosynthesis